MARLVETWSKSLSPQGGPTRPASSVALSSRPQYVAVGLDETIKIFSSTGEHLADYPRENVSVVAIHQLFVSPDMTRLILATRTGQVKRLDLAHDGNTFNILESNLQEKTGDVHTIAFSEQEDLVAIGHLSSALTLVAAGRYLLDRSPLWQQCSEQGNDPDGEIWSVAFGNEGRCLYAGSAGLNDINDNTLLSFTWEGDRTERNQEDYWNTYTEQKCLCNGRIPLIATLPGNEGVVVVLTGDDYGSTLVAYPPDLAEPRWEIPFHEPILALATDPQKSLIAASVGYEGRIVIIDGLGYIKVEDLVLNTMVNDLAMIQGRLLAAATEDGYLVLMQYKE